MKPQQNKGEPKPQKKREKTLVEKIHEDILGRPCGCLSCGRNKIPGPTATKQRNKRI